MKLTRQEIWCLRVADGIATTSDEQRLIDAGIDPDEWRNLSTQIAEALHSGEPVDFTTSVAQKLQIPVFHFGEYLRDPEAVSITETVMESLDAPARSKAPMYRPPVSVPPSATDVDLADALMDPNPPSLVDSIMGAILKEVDLEPVLEMEEAEIDSVAPLDLVSVELDSTEAEEYSVDDMDVLAEILANDIREAEQAIATAEEEFLNDTEPFSEDLSYEEVLDYPSQPEISVEMDLETADLELEVLSLTDEIEYNNAEDLQPLEDDSDEEVLDLERPIVVTEELLDIQSREMGGDWVSALRDEEAIPDLWSNIEHSIQQPPLRLIRSQEEAEMEMESAEEAATVEFLSPKIIDADSTISKVSMALLGSLLAAAAALFIFMLPQDNVTLPDSEEPLVAFELASVNELDVEELDAGDNVSVQIFQTDENAPTIIFIEEMGMDTPEGEE